MVHNRLKTECIYTYKRLDGGDAISTLLFLKNNNNDELISTVFDS